MDKLKSFWGKVLNANGHAQVVSYSFWGVLIAGMLWDFCEGCIPHELLFVWGAISFIVLPVSIWGSRQAIKVTLLADMFLSAIVMMMYFMHQPHFVDQLIYNVKASGEFVKMEHSITEWFTSFALAWMTLHSAYLANLIHRQQLERVRFHHDL